MSDTPRSRGLRPTALLRAALVALVVVVALIAQRLGVFSSLREPAQLARALVALGPWGYAAFVLAYTLLQPFGVPGTVFITAAPLIWPWPTAFALSMTGTMGASVVGFSFARFVARDWISARIPARFRAYEAALEQRGLATVFTLRFVFWMPPLLHAFFGVSRVRFSTHFWGSLAGYTVPLLLTSYFGRRLFDALRGASAREWAALGLGTVLFALIVWRLRRAYRARRRSSTPDEKLSREREPAEPR